MLQKVRNKLRKSSLLYSIYMKLKRTFSSELLGMTSLSEQKYLMRYVENFYKGRGEIVDLGCWLGSTTISLVKGLMKNPNFLDSDRKIYAYDLFIWFDWMNPSIVGTNLIGKYKEGDNFIEEFKKRTEEFESRIEICEGDLTKIGWIDKKIEFLLIDAMKNWELANAIIKDFYSSLIPNESLIFHQDFLHFFPSWIHLLQWQLRDYFEFIEEIPKSSSVVFKYKKKIPEELLITNYSFDYFSDEDVNAAFNYSISLVSSEKKADVAASKVMWFIHQEKHDKAKRVLANLLEQGTHMEGYMLTVAELIKA